MLWLICTVLDQVKSKMKEVKEGKLSESEIMREKARKKEESEKRGQKRGKRALCSQLNVTTATWTAPSQWHMEN